MVVVAVGALLAVLAGSAWAHKPSDSYLSLQLRGNGEIAGRWDIHLRDLDNAIGLDGDGDGNVTWGEVRARHADIAAYATARLAVAADGRPCTAAPGVQLIEQHGDGAYTVLPLRYVCGAAATPPRTLALRYTLFADLDPTHRGLLSLTAVDGRSRTAVFGPAASEQRFDLAAAPSRMGQMLAYAREGVWHIWIGFDHVLFLVALLLPAVLVWTPRGSGGSGLTGKSGAGGWQPASRFMPAFWEVVRVVTAFTLAHSVTLSLAALGYVALPSRLVESVIAASVVLAALNNVWPLLHGRRWAVAFAFGLIHGFGFASVLAELGLPQETLALALVGFNLGVEAGQLTIVALFLPLAWALRASAFYRRGVLLGGSLLIAALAAVWLAQRALDL